MKSRAICAVILGLVIGSLTWAQPAPVPATQLLPLEEGEKPFLITQGPNRGERTTSSLEPVEAAEGDWRLRLGEIGSVYFSERPEGDLVINRIDLDDEDSRIIYDEPVLLLPAQVTADDRREETTSARVIDAEGKRRRGEVSHILNPVSRHLFFLPSGQVHAFLVEVEQAIELDRAKVTLWLRSGLDVGRGLIYCHLRYTIDKPLWFGSTSEHILELVE